MLRSLKQVVRLLKQLNFKKFKEYLPIKKYHHRVDQLVTTSHRIRQAHI